MKNCLVRLVAILVLVVLAQPSLHADDDNTEVEKKSTWVTSISPLGSGGEFVAATADGLLLREAAVVSFQANHPNQLKTLYQHPAAVWCVDALADGSKVASVDYRGNLILFDTQSAQPTTHEKAFERWCQTMLISPDDKWIVAGNEAGKVMVWDIAAGKLAKSVELDGHAVTGLALSPDQTLLAASDGAGHVHLLKWPELEAAGEIKISEETAWCVAFSNDGQHLFVGSSDRNLYRCPAKAEAKAESVARGTDWITQLAVSPSGQIAAAEVSGKLHFPALGGSDSMDAKSGVWSLCWHGNERLVAGTRKDGIAIAGRSWKWTEPAPAEKTKEATAPAPKEEPVDQQKPKAEPEEKKAGQDTAPPAAEKKKAAEPKKEKEAAQEKKDE
ncbi:MAG: hypothetical protein MI861_21645 [Pirellulales bacterium]|nr:hypothetical protein [Pirellulales bacterium]